MKKEILRTQNELETLKAAEEFTRKILSKPISNRIIFLKGELGAGKTIFAKGVAKALGISKTVESPTFVFVREYQEGKVPFYHFDLYRIKNASELDEIGFFEYLSREGIILVEWAEKAECCVAPDIAITIEKTGEKEREIRIEYA